jgi:hypothetical protein
MTSHAEERLWERYGFEPAENREKIYTMFVDPEQYEIVRIDNIEGSEIREINYQGEPIQGAVKISRSGKETVVTILPAVNVSGAFERVQTKYRRRVATMEKQVELIRGKYKEVKSALDQEQSQLRGPLFKALAYFFHLRNNVK